MSEWKIKKLSEVADIIGGGTPSSKENAYYDNGTIPWITPKDLSNYNEMYISNGERNITELGLKNSSAKLLPKGSILFSSRAPIGYVAIANKELSTNQGFKSLVLKEGHVPEFYYYLLKQNVALFEARASGTTFKEVSGQIVKDTELSIPDKETQGKIVSILKPLDDKIQLNTETNKTLEAIAQAIFKHWFIDFAPVHAKAEALAEGKTAKQAELAAMASISGKTEQQVVELAQTNPQAYQQLQQTAAAFPSEFVESELGLVPKGWEISTFKDYATFVKGKKPKNIYLKQEGELLPHILVSSLNGEYKEFANPENMTLVSSHETIMLMDGSGSGKISIGHDGIIGSTLAKLKLNDKKYWAFIYLFLSSKTDDIQNNTTGAAIPHTDKNRVYGYPISMPNDKLLNLINKLLDGIFSKIQVHTNENQTLAKTRDTLLPKLLSGEIEL